MILYKGVIAAMSRKQPFSIGRAIVVSMILTVCWIAVAGADSIPPQIFMNTGMEQFEPGVVKTRVLDDSEVSKVTLFYRKPGESYFNSTDMKQRNDIYYQELDRELGLEGSVEYYILAQDTSGNQTTQPMLDPGQCI